MEAVLIRYSKDRNSDGSIQEIVIWQLPGRYPWYPHGVKYRLYFGLADGTCLVRYDNQRHKGDHKHLGNQEEPYLYSTVAQLIEDFLNDVEKVKEHIK